MVVSKSKRNTILHLPLNKSAFRSTLTSQVSPLFLELNGWNVQDFPLEHGYPGHEGIGEVVDGGDTDFRRQRSYIIITYHHLSAQNSICTNSISKQCYVNQ